VVERGTKTLRPWTKNGKSDDLVPILRPRLAAALDALVPDPETGLLLPKSPGNPFEYRDWSRRVWAPLMRRAGIKPRPRYHDLRHTLGTRLADGGLPTSQIKAILRHADERTTERYVHAPRLDVLAERARAALDKHAGVEVEATCQSLDCAAPAVVESALSIAGVERLLRTCAAHVPVAPGGASVVSWRLAG